MESFWGTLQLELLDTWKWQNRAEFAASVFEWIECWYNPFRRHSSLGMLSLSGYEEQYRASHNAD
ncbi:IS3 family transposase [Actinocorallia libanotica]|uniref:IS3 family transposase n=1 Tax=Actinocorallia libanotica TaxID=46162 RepID=UPI003CD081D2